MLQLSTNVILPTYYLHIWLPKILLYSTTNYHAVIEVSWKYIMIFKGFLYTIMKLCSVLQLNQSP